MEWCHIHFVPFFKLSFRHLCLKFHKFITWFVTFEDNITCSPVAEISKFKQEKKRNEFSIDLIANDYTMSDIPLVIKATYSFLVAFFGCGFWLRFLLWFGTKLFRSGQWPVDNTLYYFSITIEKTGNPTSTTLILYITPWLPANVMGWYSKPPDMRICRLLVVTWHSRTQGP